MEMSKAAFSIGGNGMKYEQAGSGDISDLVMLRLEYLWEDYGMIRSEIYAAIESSLPEYYQKHLNSDLFAYICRIQSEIVACCFLYVAEKPANPSFVKGKTGTVLNVYTKPEYRKRGIAEALLKILLDDARHMGLDYVELKSTDSGYALYQKIGFQDEPTKYHPMKYVFP